MGILQSLPCTFHYMKRTFILPLPKLATRHSLHEWGRDMASQMGKIKSRDMYEKGKDFIFYKKKHIHIYPEEVI